MRWTTTEIPSGSRRIFSSLNAGPVFSGLCLAVALALPTGTVFANDDEAKRQFVTSCGVCHTAEKDAPHRQGPNLFGIVGRKAGQIADFKYSEALAKADLTWDEATLDKWIEDASALLSGTTMPYRQRDPDKRKLVIKFLQSLSP
jgi:cytochrome c